MNRNERNTLFVVAVILLLGALLWSLRACTRSIPQAPLNSPALPVPAMAPSPAPVVAPPLSAPKPVPLIAKPVLPSVSPKAKSAPTTSPNGAPLAPTLDLHKELIPKDIAIIRCYYQQDIVPPGTVLGFDINGSGFTKEFEHMIKVEAGAPGIRIRNLHLVTANQIHGEMEISTDAQTAFIFPRVLIQNLPVFSAPEPYAVIRKGEVLTILFISMEENGRAGRFRVLTNLDNDLLQNFHIVPSTAGLDISDITPRLPYAVEGTLRIGQRVPPGEYGLVIQIGDKTALRRDGMIRIVKPNVGSTGFIQAVTPEEPYQRPGDTIQMYVQGSGFIPQNITDLRAQISEFDMGPGSFTFLNAGQMRLTFQSPASAPPGSYSITIQNTQGQKLYDRKNTFQLVGSNWMAGLQVTPPVRAGGKSTLKILGRDLSPEFAQALKIDLDEPGITLSQVKRQDSSTLIADISVADKVAPGDYWLHLSANGKKISPAYGSLIKVEAP
jgi:hypothetical protein